MQAELILYAVIAAGLVYWLRSILGTRHGDERERPNPFTTSTAEQKTSELSAIKVNDDVITLPLGETRPQLPRNVTIASEAAERGLADIARNAIEFDAAKFSQNAQDAFAMIVESFAEGDRDTLKNLLEPKVFAAFDRAIADRESKGEKMTTEIHAVRRAEILDAKQDSGTAYITVRFIADETCVVRDAGGAILSGDPERITEMNDIWIFSHPLRSRNPAWLVHETRDGDVKEDHKTPVPDSV